MAYSKLYSSIVHSSLWTEPDHIRLLFITLLALADREGYVFGSRNGLLRAANLDPAQCEENDPFQALLAPDKDSSDLLRNPENEGRRIEQIDGGFRLLNFAHYRDIFDAEDRREQNRAAKARQREKEKAMTVSKRQQASASVIQNQPSEVDVEVDVEEDAETARVNPSKVHTLAPSSDHTPPTDYSLSGESFLLDSVDQFLGNKEMEANGAMWRMRIRAGKDQRKALRNALEDFAVRTPDQQAKLHNRAAWLTDRYERCLKEVLMDAMQ